MNQVRSVSTQRMRGTHGGVDETDGLLADGETGIVDCGEDRRHDGGRCGRAVDEVEVALHCDDVVRAT